MTSPSAPRPVSDTRIACWLGLSPATYYRWRAAGLLPCQPRSAEEAREMRARVEAARDCAAFNRPPGLLGRTRLDDIAHELGDRPWQSYG